MYLRLFENVKDALMFIPNYLFVKPLKSIYFLGPRFWGWGGWEGIESEDICAQLKQVPSHVWAMQMNNCIKLLEKKFQTFLVGCITLFYTVVAYQIFSYLWYRYLVLGPLIRELKIIYYTGGTLKDKLNENKIIKQ